MGRSSKLSEFAAAYDTGSSLAFRNRLINAEFLINQRVYVSGTNTSGANQYTLDRWRVVTSGQNISWTTSGNVVTVTAPAGGVEQVIEGSNLVTGTYVLNWTGTATATVGGSAVSKGGTVSVTGGSNLTIRFSGGTVSLPQFEVGTKPTNFERRMGATELALCQRYYEKSYAIGTTPGAATAVGATFTSVNGSASTLYMGFTDYFKVTKRATPLLSYWDVNGASSRSSSYTGGGLVRVDGNNNVYSYVGSESSAQMTLSAGSNLFYAYQWTADAEL